MRTPKENRTEVRNNFLVVKMTLEEKNQLQNAADTMGLPMSSYVRMLVKQDIERGKNND